MKNINELVLDITAQSLHINRYGLINKALKDAKLKERKRIGRQFKKWFLSNNIEDIESAIERITGVKV